MKKIFKHGGKLACLLFLSNIGDVVAQIPTKNLDVPIDGGASILAAAGVGYGIKKYRDYRKSSENQETEI